MWINMIGTGLSSSISGKYDWVGYLLKVPAIWSPTCGTTIKSPYACWRYNSAPVVLWPYMLLGRKPKQQNRHQYCSGLLQTWNTMSWVSHSNPQLYHSEACVWPIKPPRLPEEINLPASLRVYGDSLPCEVTREVTREVTPDVMRSGQPTTLAGKKTHKCMYDHPSHWLGSLGTSSNESPANRISQPIRGELRSLWCL